MVCQRSHGFSSCLHPLGSQGCLWHHRGCPSHCQSKMLVYMCSFTHYLLPLTRSVSPSPDESDHLSDRPAPQTPEQQRKLQDSWETDWPVTALPRPLHSKRRHTEQTRCASSSFPSSSPYHLVMFSYFQAWQGT